MQGDPQLTVDGAITGFRVITCRSGLARLLGSWRWRGRVPGGCALWFSPCRALHTLALPAPIDIAFCDRGGAILRLEQSLGRNRAVACRRAAFAVEFPAGAAAGLGLAPGRCLGWIDPPLEGKRPPRGQASAFRPAARQQVGASLVEFALVVVLGLLPVALGLLQACALLAAHDVLALAAHQVARQAAMDGADPQALRASLARGLLPLYVPAARDGQLTAAQAAAAYARATADARLLDDIAILEPTRRQVEAWAIRRDGRDVLPNEAIEARTEPFRQASVLTLAIVHCQPLVVPLVGPALASALAALGTSGEAAEARCLAAGRAPLRVRASMPLQADLPIARLPAP